MNASVCVKTKPTLGKQQSSANRTNLEDNTERMSQAAQTTKVADCWRVVPVACGKYVWVCVCERTNAVVTHVTLVIHAEMPRLSCCCDRNLQEYETVNTSASALCFPPSH